MSTIRLLQWNLFAGHGYGLKGPFLVYGLRWPHETRWSMQKVLTHLMQHQPILPEQRAQLSTQELDSQGFIQLFHALEIALSNPFAQPAQLLATQRHASSCIDHWIALATQHVNGAIALLQWLIQLIHEAHQVADPDVVREDGAQLLKTAKSYGLSINRSVNRHRIVQAAYALNIPVRTLPSTILMLGTGKYAQYFDSTITQRTPSMGVDIARRKSLTSQYLRLHGLPTPTHQVIGRGDVEAAVAAANSMGFPVVIKPNDLDGGVGVYAGLSDEAQLRECFPLAAEKSANLLIEQHIVGDDYRITVIDGAVVKAIGRRPGGVLGDGVRTIEEIAKADAAYIEQHHPGRKTVALDAEALSVLTAAGRSFHDVLPHGVFQALRRRANMSTGGTSWNVRDIIHPDNVRLAIQATQALQLDIAGIDFITPDIERSWMDVKSAICEVNSQPQISLEFAEHVYVDLLQKRMPQRVRMRTVLVVDFDADSAQQQPLLQHVEAELVRQLETVMCIHANGTWLSGVKILPASAPIFKAAMQAELNAEATTVLTCLSIQSIFQSGIPWQQIDHLCVINLEEHPSEAQKRTLEKLQRLLRGHVIDPVLTCKKNISQSLPVELSGGWPPPLRQTPL